MLKTATTKTIKNKKHIKACFWQSMQYEACHEESDPHVIILKLSAKVSSMPSDTFLNAFQVSYVLCLVLSCM